MSTIHDFEVQVSVTVKVRAPGGLVPDWNERVLAAVRAAPDSAFRPGWVTLPSVPDKGEEKG
jgi:hypothetical protein